MMKITTTIRDWTFLRTTTITRKKVRFVWREWGWWEIEKIKLHSGYKQRECDRGNKTFGCLNCIRNSCGAGTWQKTLSHTFIPPIYLLLLCFRFIYLFIVVVVAVVGIRVEFKFNSIQNKQLSIIFSRFYCSCWCPERVF